MLFDHPAYQLPGGNSRYHYSIDATKSRRSSVRVSLGKSRNLTGTLHANEIRLHVIVGADSVEDPMVTHDSLATKV